MGFFCSTKFIPESLDEVLPKAQSLCTKLNTYETIDSLELMERFKKAVFISCFDENPYKFVDVMIGKLVETQALINNTNIYPGMFHNEKVNKFLAETLKLLYAASRDKKSGDWQKIKEAISLIPNSKITKELKNSLAEVVFNSGISAVTPKL